MADVSPIPDLDAGLVNIELRLDEAESGSVPQGVAILALDAGAPARIEFAGWLGLLRALQDFIERPADSR